MQTTSELNLLVGECNTLLNMAIPFSKHVQLYLVSQKYVLYLFLSVFAIISYVVSTTSPFASHNSKYEYYFNLCSLSFSISTYPCFSSSVKKERLIVCCQTGRNFRNRSTVCSTNFSVSPIRSAA